MGKQQLTRPQQQQLITLADAYAAFLASRQAANVTPRTLGFYSDKLLPFITWCTKHGLTTVDEVTAAHVRAHLIELQKRNLSPWTVHGAARAIRTFLRFCAADSLIDTAPKFAMPKLPKRILPAFEPVDVARLLDTCEHPRDRLTVLVLLDTGMRASEFVALNGGDIDTGSGAVNIANGKGQKQRTVYLGAKTRRELAQYWRKHGVPGALAPAWVSLTTGERLTDSGLRQLLQRLGDLASVANCHPHTFRRTFALWSLRAGMSIYHLQRLMGHEDIGVLRQYLALVDVDLQKAHQAAGVVDRMIR